MLEEFEIRKKWREICQRNRPKGCIIDSGAFAVELVRWVESGLTPLALDAALWVCQKCGEASEVSSQQCSVCNTPRQ